VLDLYELYNLVVARGGLVEVINKKIWREITKGLNLPSSITSAAFTLRTQYMKYLYPYECEKENMSSADELQMAIDGNRREGRRSSYGAYPEMGGSPPPTMTSSNVAALLGNGAPASQVAAAQQALSSMDLFGRAGLDLTSTLSLMSRQLNGHHNGSPSVTGHGLNHNHHSQNNNNLSHSSSGDEEREGSVSPPPIGVQSQITPQGNASVKGERAGSPSEEPIQKRFKNQENSPVNGGFSGMNIKMNSKGKFHFILSSPFTHFSNLFSISCQTDGRALDGQITMSIEVNGTLYHGILFAQNQNK